MSNQNYGKFQLIKKLATGGMAEVYFARQLGIEGFSKDIVVKRILPHLAEDREFVEMFKHEAVVAARFNHPNIAQVYEFAEVNGSYFIAMEFIHGEDLGRVMRKAWKTNQWMTRPLAIRIIASAAEGLHYAHTRTGDDGRPLKVVHRDISPQNILVSFDGSVKIVDFGIAKAADSSNLTKSGAIKGKFAYMAPEQAAGKPLDHRVDVYALGLVLYELLTGVRPLKRDTELATLQAALEGNIEPPSEIADVPPELDPIVMKALAKTPDDRYRDARQFQMELEELLVAQRWVAGSVQIAELMETLFSDRLEEEARVGTLQPRSESQFSMMPSLPGPDPQTDPAGQRPPSDVTEGTQRATPRSLSRANAPKLEMPDVPDWEAPPATVAKSSRSINETRVAEMPRRNTGTGMRRVDEPQLREDLSEDVPLETRYGEPRRPERLRPLPERAPLSDATRMEPFPEPPPNRRRSSSGQHAAVRAPTPGMSRPRRTASRGQMAVAEMPEAPAMTPRPMPVTEAPQEKKGPSKAEIIMAGLRAGENREKVKRLGTVLLVLAVAISVFVFRAPLIDMLSSSATSRGQGVLLEVKSNLSVDIWVVHPPGERGNPEEVKVKLGSGRNLPPVEGAHLGDTIVLENAQLGARYEETLEYGEPGEVKLINHEFREGQMRLSVTPKQIVAVKVYLEGQERGLVPGLIGFYEGAKTLELRSKAFREPKLLNVNIRPDTVLEMNVDVRDVLNESPKR